MALKNRFISDESGASLILIALMLPVLIMVMGVTVDLGRLYAVRSKAQGALDAALLGAVATASTTPVQNETRRLFRANFPASYLGSQVNNPGVSEASGTYTATVRVRVPNNILQLFGIGRTTLNLTSKVSNSTTGSTLEIAMVMDNSAGVDVSNMRASASVFINTLFGGNNTLPSTYVSLLPYNVAVNTGYAPLSRIFWAQNLLQYILFGGQYANRNPDIPPNANFADVKDDPPTGGAQTRFRTPYMFAPGSFNNGDGVTLTLAEVLFGSNSKAQLLNAINSMRAGGATRINVGLMWGWFALSPRWTGVWEPGKPNLPLVANSSKNKIVILVSGQRNNVYLGVDQVCGAGTCPVSNDNLTTLMLCNTIKLQGMRVYAVGYGPPANYNAAQLAACSSGPGYFFEANNSAQLSVVFQTIVDNIRYSSIRLSQ